MFSNLFKQTIVFLLATVLFWTQFPFDHHGLNANANTEQILTLAENNSHSYDWNEINSHSYDWNEIDRQLSESLRAARLNTEELAQFELNAWKRELMKKVDDDFLDWYYGYFTQKAMEFGIPFAWLMLKLDQPFDNLSRKDEKDLNAAEIIQKRMVEDFNRKFKKLVLNREAEELLKEKIERVGITYATSIGTQFSKVKAQYQVTDPEWEEHLGKLAQLIYDTGNSESDLSAVGINSNLSTKVFAATTVTVGTKLAAKFATKAVGKTATKAGASVAAKTGAELLNPFLAVGFLVWDVWDYQNMVDKSRPELRQNISDYLEELKYSILAGEDSILSALSEVEADLYRELQNLSSNYS